MNKLVLLFLFVACMPVMGGVEQEVVYFRGDVNNDGAVNISDYFPLFNYVFNGGSPPECVESADVNGDGAVDSSDPIYLLNALFSGGPPIAEPSEVCAEEF